MSDGFKGSKARGQSRNLITETVSPANGADVTPASDTELLLVNPDGTNTIKLDNLDDQQGARLVVVHNGGSSTPTIAFESADFTDSGPSNITTDGASATIINFEGAAGGWTVV